MKVRIEQERLEKLLSAVKHVIGRAATLPILGHVVFKAEKKELHVTASNMEQTLTVTVPDCLELEEGSSAILFQRLMALAKQEKDIISISTGEKDTVKIEGCEAIYTMQAMDAEEMPSPKKEKRKSISLPIGELKWLLLKTIHAVSEDPTRYVLNGVLLTIDGGDINAVATDGRRLACASYPDIDHDIDVSAILPAQAVKTLIKILADDCENDVEIAIGKNSAEITWPGYTFHTVLIDGIYPNYKQVIPVFKKPVTVEIGAEHLHYTASKASIMTTAENPAVSLELSEGNLVLSSRAPDVGDAVIKAHPKKSPASAKVIHVSVGLLIDATDVCNQVDPIVLQWEDETSALTIHANRFLTVIMPLRVR